MMSYRVTDLASCSEKLPMLHLIAKIVTSRTITTITYTHISTSNSISLAENMGLICLSMR